MPFLDILVIPEQDGSLSTTVYRKPTHTDLYFQWDSHHTVSAKYSVVGPLYNRAETICSSPHLLQQEQKHLQKALHRCKYPAWALNRVKIKETQPKEATPQELVITIPTSRDHTLWYPIIEGWVKASRRYAVGMECKFIVKEAIPSRTSWWPQRTKILSWEKVGSSIDTVVIGWIAMRNTLVNPLGCLVTSSRNIKRDLPPFLTILPSLVMTSVLITLALWGGKTRTWIELSKKPYLLGSIIHP